MKNIFFSKKTVISIIAATIIVGVFIGCVYRKSLRNSEGLAKETYSTQEAMADGNYSDLNSDSPKSEEKPISASTTQSVVNILEILPYEGLAQIGYTIGGCEPVADNDADRKMIMDGIYNSCPGNYDITTNSRPILTDMAMNTSSEFKAMGYKREECVGYYEKVDDGKGVYSLSSVSYDANGYVDDVVMVSKFYTGGGVDSSGKNNYVWHDNVGQTMHTDQEKLEQGGPIYLYHHYKTTYYNNEEFLSVLYSDSTTTGPRGVNGVDGVRGMYTFGTGVDPNIITGVTDNKSKIEDWKKTHTVKVNTKSPKNVTAIDIDSADIIVMCACVSDGSYDFSLQVNNKITGNSYKKEDFTFDDGNNLSWENVIRIYERVVIKQDVSFLASETCTSGNNFDTNIRKLMCMLFLVHDNHAGDDPDNMGSGREMFMDYMKKYVDDPVYNALRDSDERYICPALSDKGKRMRREGIDCDVSDLAETKHYMYGNDVNGYEGFPYFLDPTKAIVGYNEATKEPIYYSEGCGIDYRDRVMRVKSESDFTNAGIPAKYRKENNKWTDIVENENGYWEDELCQIDYVVSMDGSTFPGSVQRDWGIEYLDLKQNTTKVSRPYADTLLSYENKQNDRGVNISARVNMNVSEVRRDGDDIVLKVEFEIGGQSTSEEITKNKNSGRLRIKPVGNNIDNKYNWGEGNINLFVTNQTTVPVCVYGSYYDPFVSVSGDAESKNPGNDERYKYCVRMYPTRSNTTDFAYITMEDTTDSNGNTIPAGSLVFDPKYSNQWYHVDDNTEKGDWDDKRVSWNNRITSNPYTKWPSDFMRTWWFGQTDGGENCHIPVYFQYYGWGNYSFKDYVGVGNYRNQSVFQESYTLYKYGDGGQANLFSKATDKTVKHDAEHKDVVEASKDCFMSINILNGDSYSGDGDNKIVYVNQYELAESGHKGVPIIFTVGSSEQIVKIELFRAGGTTPIITYVGDSSNDITDSTKSPLKFNVDAAHTDTPSEFGELTLQNITEYDSTTDKPKGVYGTAYKYFCNGTIEPGILKKFYTTGVNNKFSLKVTIDIGDPKACIEDEITVVVKDFFDLN